MTDEKAEQVESLLATPDLANALESEQFKHFLDQVPIAIVVSEMKGAERIAYGRRMSCASKTSSGPSPKTTKS